MRTLLDELGSRSPRFAELWHDYRLEPLGVNTRTVNHPELGALRLDCNVLAVPDADLRIVVCTATPGSAAASGLRQLAVD